MRGRPARPPPPGQLFWTKSEESHQTWQSVSVTIRVDGTAHVGRKGAEGVDEFMGPDGFESLEDPAYFADCLHEAAVIARFERLRGGLGEQLEECVPRTQPHSD